MAVVVAADRLPIIDVSFEGTSTDEEFAEYLQRLYALRTTHSGTVTIIDARRAGFTPLRQRRMQTAWIREHADMLRARSRGTAFVLSSPMNRGALSAMLWMVPLPMPHVVVATPQQAEAWARERLRDPSCVIA